MVEDVLSATLDVLAEIGYAALRIEEVAHRAGVNKTSIYRRWPTKPDLLREALTAFWGAREILPDTGTLRGDLAELLQRTLDEGATPIGRARARMLVLDDPEINPLTKTLRDAILARRATLIERAIDRGELPAGTDAALMIELLFVPLWLRIAGETGVPQDFLRRIDFVLAGARATHPQVSQVRSSPSD